MDIGGLFTNSWQKLSANIGMGIVIFLLGSIAASVIGGITLGIMMWPIYAGMYKAFRKMQRGETPEINDLFSEFSNMGRWFQVWLVFIVLGICLGVVYFVLMLTGIGLLILPFVGIALGVFLFFTFPLMVDRNMAALDAIKGSFNKMKGEFGTYFLPALLVLLVAGVFVILTGPLALIATWEVYDRAYSA